MKNPSMNHAPRIFPALLGIAKPMLVLIALSTGISATDAKAWTAGDSQAQAILDKEGLQEIRIDGLDSVHARPDASLSGYTKVFLKPVTVAFRRDWGRGTSGSRRISSGDAQRIKERLATLVHEEMVAELAKGGFQVVDSPADDVLEVGVAIENLYITAPDVMSAGRTRAYALSVGEMSMAAELRDSTSGDLIARIHDHEAGREYMDLRMITRVDNVAEARSAVAGWARALRNQLDLARKIGAGS